MHNKPKWKTEFISYNDGGPRINQAISTFKLIITRALIWYLLSQNQYHDIPGIAILIVDEIPSIAHLYPTVESVRVYATESNPYCPWWVALIMRYRFVQIWRHAQKPEVHRPDVSQHCQRPTEPRSWAICTEVFGVLDVVSQKCLQSTDIEIFSHVHHNTLLPTIGRVGLL